MRRLVRFACMLGAAGVLLAATPGGGRVPSVSAQDAAEQFDVEQTVEYGCSDQPEPFNVPPGVTQLTIIHAEGASGGAGSLTSGAPGRGSGISADLPVAPGTLLTITVGCRNGYGFSHGGPGGEGTQESGTNGGGATAIHDTSGGGLGVLLVAAGGGGGGGRGFFRERGGTGGNAVAVIREGDGTGAGGTGAGAGAGGSGPARDCIPENTRGGYGSNEGGGGGGGRFGGGSGGGGGGGLSYTSSRLVNPLMGLATSSQDGRVKISFDGPANLGPRTFGCAEGRTTYTTPAGSSGVVAAVTGGNDASGALARGVVAFLPAAPGSVFELAAGCGGAPAPPSNPRQGGAGGAGWFRGGSGGVGGPSQGGRGGGGGGGASGIAMQGGEALVVGGGGGGPGGNGYDGEGGAGGIGGEGAGADGTVNRGVCFTCSDNVGRGGAFGTSGSPMGGAGASAPDRSAGGGGGGGDGGMNGGAGGGSVRQGEIAGGGGGGGRNFAHPTLAHRATPLPPGAGRIVIYPLWGLVACPPPPATSTVRCYDVATASVVAPPP